jgi:hypothetical protein
MMNTQNVKIGRKVAKVVSSSAIVREIEKQVAHTYVWVTTCLTIAVKLADGIDRTKATQIAEMEGEKFVAELLPSNSPHLFIGTAGPAYVGTVDGTPDKSGEYAWVSVGFNLRLREVTEKELASFATMAIHAKLFKEACKLAESLIAGKVACKFITPADRYLADAVGHKLASLSARQSKRIGYDYDKETDEPILAEVGIAKPKASKPKATAKKTVKKTTKKSTKKSGAKK